MDADKSKASKGTKNNNFKTHKNSIVIKRNQNLSTKKKKPKILAISTYLCIKVIINKNISYLDVTVYDLRLT